MSKVLLGVIGNGRYDLLESTIASMNSHLKGNFFKKVMIDDTGDINYARFLQENYGDEFHIVSHLHNKGLSGSVISLWNLAEQLEVDYIFHLEEDFTFNQDVYIETLEYILTSNPHLAQIALKRQPCNADEANAGGFMQLNPSSYTENLIPASFGEEKKMVVTSHRNFFTLNPCLYPMSTVRVGWKPGWGEKEFGEKLFSDPNIKCGYVNGIESDPTVNHIGNYRASSWFV